MPYFPPASSSGVVLNPSSSSTNVVQGTASTVIPLVLKGKNDAVTPVSPISWTNLRNVSTAGTNTVTKTGGANGGFDAGADSTQQIVAGKDGYVEWVANNTQTVCIGLNSTANTNHISSLINFGIYQASSSQIQYIEIDAAAGVLGTYTTGDVLRVEVADGIITYKKNGSILRTTSAGVAFPMWCAVNLQSTGASQTVTYVNDNSGQQAVDLLDFQNGTGTVLSSIDNTGRIKATSGFAVVRTDTATNYTILKTDYWVNVTSTASARTITLKAASSYGVNQMFIVTDGSNAAGTNNITLQLSGSDTWLGGGTTKVINTNGGIYRIVTDGASKWYVI